MSTIALTKESAALHQENKTAYELGAYISELTTMAAGEFTFRTGASRVVPDLLMRWPTLPAREKEARALCMHIANAIYPIAQNTLAQAVKVSVRIFSEPLPALNHVRDISTLLIFDAQEGTERQLFLSPKQHLPPKEQLSAASGISILCRPINRNYHTIFDDRKMMLGAGLGIFEVSQRLVNESYYEPLYIPRNHPLDRRLMGHPPMRPIVPGDAIASQWGESMTAYSNGQTDDYADMDDGPLNSSRFAALDAGLVGAGLASAGLYALAHHEHELTLHNPEQSSALAPHGGPAVADHARGSLSHETQPQQTSVLTPPHTNNEIQKSIFYPSAAAAVFTAMVHHAPANDDGAAEQHEPVAITKAQGASRESELYRSIVGPASFIGTAVLPSLYFFDLPSPSQGNENIETSHGIATAEREAVTGKQDGIDTVAGTNEPPAALKEQSSSALEAASETPALPAEPTAGKSQITGNPVQNATPQPVDAPSDNASVGSKDNGGVVQRQEMQAQSSSQTVDHQSPQASPRTAQEDGTIPTEHIDQLTQHSDASFDKSSEAMSHFEEPRETRQQQDNHIEEPPHVPSSPHAQESSGHETSVRPQMQGDLHNHASPENVAHNEREVASHQIDVSHHNIEPHNPSQLPHGEGTRMEKWEGHEQQGSYLHHQNPVHSSHTAHEMHISAERSHDVFEDTHQFHGLHHTMTGAKTSDHPYHGRELGSSPSMPFNSPPRTGFQLFGKGVRTGAFGIRSIAQQLMAHIHPRYVGTLRKGPLAAFASRHQSNTTQMATVAAVANSQPVPTPEGTQMVMMPSPIAQTTASPTPPEAAPLRPTNPGE